MKSTWTLPLIAASFLISSAAFADTVLITGANSGLGLEFAKEYAAKGWTVIATHRRPDVPESLAEVQAKHKNVQIEHLDVADLDDIKKLATKLKGVPIDVLINNAGVYADRSVCANDEACRGEGDTQMFTKTDYALFDQIMAVNVRGPLAVSEAFIANVRASKQKKLIAISSSNGTLTGEKQPRAGTIFYRMSKAAVNREFQIVAASVKKDGVTVLMFNPGPTLTEHQEYLDGRQGMLKTSFTVENMIRTTEKATIEDTGKFLRYDGQTEPW